MESHMCGDMHTQHSNTRLTKCLPFLTLSLKHLVLSLRDVCSPGQMLMARMMTYRCRVHPPTLVPRMDWLRSMAVPLPGTFCYFIICREEGRGHS